MHVLSKETQHKFRINVFRQHKQIEDSLQIQTTYMYNVMFVQAQNL